MENNSQRRKRFQKQFKAKGRERNIFLCIRISKEENERLNQDMLRTKKSKSEYVRDLIMHSKIHEKPDERFYELSKNLIKIGGNLNQIAIKANSLNFIDADAYKKEVEDLNKYKSEIRNKYL